MHIVLVRQLSLPHQKPFHQHVTAGWQKSLSTTPPYRLLPCCYHIMSAASGENGAKGIRDTPISPESTINKQCCSCYEIKRLSEGIECNAVAGSTRHYNCNDCMSGYIASMSGPDNAPYLQLGHSDGCVACPIVPCSSSYFHPTQ